MKTLLFIVLLCFALLGSVSCNKEVKGLKEEMKILKEENSILKAENIVLKRELDQVYKRLEEKDKVAEAARMKAESGTPEKAGAPVKAEPGVKEGDKKKAR